MAAFEWTNLTPKRSFDVVKKSQLTRCSHLLETLQETMAFLYNDVKERKQIIPTGTIAILIRVYVTNVGPRRCIVDISPYIHLVSLTHSGAETQIQHESEAVKKTYTCRCFNNWDTLYEKLM